MNKIVIKKNELSASKTKLNNNRKMSKKKKECKIPITDLNNFILLRELCTANKLYSKGAKILIKCDSDKSDSLSSPIRTKQWKGRKGKLVVSISQT